jgi:hypothetical protein
MARHRPIGATILAVSGALGALVSASHALPYLGVLPSVSGPLSSSGRGRREAVLRALWAAIRVRVTVAHWRVDQQGWRFVAVISAPNSILAGPGVPGASASQARPPAILHGGAVPRCSPMPGVEDAGVGSTIASHR